MNIIKTLEKYEARGMHHQLPIVWESAEDSYVWDINEKRYIDFSSIICVTNTGHSNPKIIEAIEKQLEKGMIASYTFATEERAKFVEKLCKLTKFDKVFLASAGTEVTDTAIKLMWKYSKKPLIVSFLGAMHGKSYMAELLKGTCSISNIRYLDFPNGDYTKLERPNEIAGIIIETYQGWSARFYPKDYIQALCKWAKKHNILVCFDEVQGGMGRTGRLFNYEHYEVQPDLVCCGKGLGGGLPISAVLGRKDIIDCCDDLSSTHSGNPLCCAGALANLEYLIEHNLIKTTQQKGHILQGYLEDIKNSFPDYILEHNGAGLLAGLVTKDEKFATAVCYRALNQGLILIYTGRESIKIAPPLTIRYDILEKGCKILYEAIKDEIGHRHTNTQ